MDIRHLYITIASLWIPTASTRIRFKVEFHSQVLLRHILEDAEKEELTIRKKEQKERRIEHEKSNNIDRRGLSLSSARRQSQNTASIAEASWVYKRWKRNSIRHTSLNVSSSSTTWVSLRMSHAVIEHEKQLDFEARYWTWICEFNDRSEMKGGNSISISQYFQISFTHFRASCARTTRDSHIDSTHSSFHVHWRLFVESRVRSTTCCYDARSLSMLIFFSVRENDWNQNWLLYVFSLSLLCVSRVAFDSTRS